MAALVKAGPDLQATGCQGFTLLHLAALEGHAEVVAALVEAGSDIEESSNSSGHTPLHLGSNMGHLGEGLRRSRGNDPFRRYTTYPGFGEGAREGADNAGGGRRRSRSNDHFKAHGGASGNA